MTDLLRLWHISWRNIFRNPRRTLLTLLILVLGCVGLILVGGFFESLLVRLRESYIFSQTGHLVVNKKGFQVYGQMDPSSYLMEGIEKVHLQIEKAPHVKFTAPRLYAEGMLSTDNNSISVLAIGVIPSREKIMLDHRYIDGAPAIAVVEGEAMSIDDPYGILIGESLQKSMGLKVGDSVSFITQQKGGAIDGADFHIRGVFQAAMKEVGERSVKIPLGTLQGILNVPDQAHSLLVILDNTANTGGAIDYLDKKLNAAGGPFELIPWYEQGKIHNQTHQFLNGIYRVVQVIISIIFFFSIANTINMALLERMREYGTMMAMGNNRPTIFQMILLESCFIGLIGSGIGVIVGLLMGNIISAGGIHMPPPPLVADNVDWMTILVLVTPKLLAESFFLTFFATLVSAMLPAYRASHVPVIRALGYT